MQAVIGYLLVGVGLVFVILALLGWLGIVTPRKAFAIAEAGWPDVAVAIIKTVPWVALVGLALIYAGLRTAGIDLSLG